MTTNNSASEFRLNYLDRGLRNMVAIGGVTMLAVALAIAYLSPFGYMVTTSFKTRPQISRDTILPLTQETYEYTGEPLPNYRITPGDQFPTYMSEDGERVWALIVDGAPGEENVYLDIISQEIIRSDVNPSTLAPGKQIALYKYRGDNMPELGLAKSKEYPTYIVETDDGPQTWALVQTPQHVFIDTNNVLGGVIEWDGDLAELEIAPQQKEYRYPGDAMPEYNIEKRGRYPVYATPDSDVESQEWAYVGLAEDEITHIYIAFEPTTDEVIEVVESEVAPGDLDIVLQPALFEYEEDDDPSLGLVEDTEYPLYRVPTPDGEMEWALVRPATDSQSAVFVDPADPEVGGFEYEVDPAEIAPIWEPGQFRQLETEDRAYGLKKNEWYPTFIAPDGSTTWALVRQGTTTDESIFINTQSEDERAPEIIQQAIDPTTLTPVVEEFTYRHEGQPLPEWSLAPGDELPLYENPDGDSEWALVKGYLPSAGKDSIFIDPENPDAGVFAWGEQFYESLDSVDRLDPTFENYPDAWEEVNFPRLLFNTAFIAFVGMFGTLVSCTIVAYGFARFPIPYKNVIFLVLLSTIVLPKQVTLVPTYVVFSEIGWTNTWLPLLVPHFFSNAYNVFLLRQFFQTIPRAMDEAAMIDGAGPFKILTRIIVPQSWPALVAAGLFHLVFAWNDYFEPLIYLLNAPDLQPISVGVQQFNFIYNQRPELIQATSLMALAIPVAIFFFAQRFFMQGIVITGVDK